MTDYYESGGKKLKEKDQAVKAEMVGPKVEKTFKKNKIDPKEIKKILTKILLIEELELITAEELEQDQAEDEELDEPRKVQQIHYEIFPCLDKEILFDPCSRSYLIACWDGDKVKEERYNENKIRAYVRKEEKGDLYFLIEILFPQKGWQHGKKVVFAKKDKNQKEKGKNYKEMIIGCINDLLKKGLGKKSPQI